jgi:hypothetical protein
MWDLLGKKDSCATIKLSTVKERFGEKIARKLLCLKSSLSAVRICVQRADGFFNILIDIRIVSIFCI